MEIQQIQHKIYEIRGQRVMIDRDLAVMYGLETKRLKEAVRRNIERFDGEDFMFQLSEEEIAKLSRTQFATLNKSRGYNIKYAPFAFTELGVAMLSSVLNSKTAIEVNRGIMRTFVVVRQSIGTKPSDKLSVLQQEMSELKAYLEDVFADQNDINEDTRMQIELINQSLAELHSEKSVPQLARRKIGYITDNE